MRIGRWARRLLLLAIVLLAVVLVTAWPVDLRAILPSALRPAAKPTPVWALTGLPREGTPQWPPFVVKMDNTPSSKPQLGVESADLVVEELVEGGLTRLAVFFQSQVPPVMGPVRSMRASDIPVVLPTGATIVTSGAALPTMVVLKASGVKFIENLDGTAISQQQGFFRDPSRYPPYNLFIRSAALHRALPPPTSGQSAYLPWSTAAAYDALPSRPARTVTAVFSPDHTTAWTYAAGRYTDPKSNAAQPFPADTVLVLRVHEADAGYLDPAGHHVPQTVLSGTGDAYLFHAGRVVVCRWSKSAPAAPISLSQAGRPVGVPAGHTWVELLPVDTDGGSLTYR